MSANRNTLLAVVIAANLTSCTPSETIPPDMPYGRSVDGSAQSAPTIPRIEVPEVPPAKCIDRLQSESIPGPVQDGEALANDCRRVQQQGRIALINFDTPTPFIDAVAKHVPNVIGQATAGLATPTVTVIPASSEAKELLNEHSPKCIESLDSGASTIAQFVMSLEKYDSVVGISTKPICDKSAAGQGYSPGKTSDIFLGSIGGATKEMKLPPAKTLADETISYIISHEVLHNLFIFGHMGDLVCKSSVSPAVAIPLESTLSRLPDDNPTTFDLKAYLNPKMCTYHEYTASSNVMGYPHPQGVEIQKLQPHPIQTDMLLQQASPGNQLSLARSLDGNKALVIEMDEMDERGTSLYASITLPSPITFKGYKDHVIGFDKLIITPVTREPLDDGSSTFNAPEAYLFSSESRNIARLGHTAEPGGEEGTFHFGIGDKRVLRITQTTQKMTLDVTG